MIIGVVFAVLELRNLVRTRQTDMAIRLYQNFGSKEFWKHGQKTMTVEFKDYNDFMKKYGTPVYSENPVNIGKIIIPYEPLSLKE